MHFRLEFLQGVWRSLESNSYRWYRMQVHLTSSIYWCVFVCVFIQYKSLYFMKYQSIIFKEQLHSEKWLCANSAGGSPCLNFLHLEAACSNCISAHLLLMHHCHHLSAVTLQIVSSVNNTGQLKSFTHLGDLSGGCGGGSNNIFSSTRIQRSQETCLKLCNPARFQWVYSSVTGYSSTWRTFIALVI